MIPILAKPASFCLQLAQRWSVLWRVNSFFFFFLSLQFLLPTQTSTIMWSFCVFCSFFFDLITPNLARVLIRCIFVTVNKLNFLHHLSESSSKCRSPEINCGLMSDWECTRNWNQTQSSASKVLFWSFWILRFIRILH